MSDEFEVGDRIRYKGGGDMAAQPGAEAVVTDVRKSHVGYLYIKWDKDDARRLHPRNNKVFQQDGMYRKELFELVPEGPTEEELAEVYRSFGFEGGLHCPTCTCGKEQHDKEQHL